MTLTLTFFILQGLTSSFVAVIITMATRGRRLTRNVNIGSAASAFIVYSIRTGWEDLH